MSLERFFCEGDLGAPGTTQELRGPEAHHLARVMRKKVGDEITLFDGRGREAGARIVEIKKQEVALEILALTEITRMPWHDIALDVALPRAGEAQDLVRRAIECGVSEIRPLQTERSVHRADKKDPQKRQDRFEKAALAALKQSGRNVLPRFLEPIALADIRLEGDLRGFFGSTRGGAGPRQLERRSMPRKLRIVVGPEGGFSPAEEDLLLARGFEAVSLGAGVLRVETAVVALVTWLASLTPEPGEDSRN